MPKVNRTDNLGKVAQEHPEAAKVMLDYGLHCVGCFANQFDSVEVGAKLHGMSDQEIEEMLQEINRSVKSASQTNGARNT